MDSSGFIEGLNGPGGVPSSATASPAVGMTVQKSGRTTGHTTGTIGWINTSVTVQYQPTCGQGRKRNFSYTNQVVINGTSFSAGGDSGSLILTNTSCAHPVALLFAGSSSTTIGNPIADVLSALAGTGHSVSFVGTNLPVPLPQPPTRSRSNFHNKRSTARTECWNAIVQISCRDRRCWALVWEHWRIMPQQPSSFMSTRRVLSNRSCPTRSITFPSES